MSMDLTQSEADILLALPKRAKEQKSYDLPIAGGKLEVPLLSLESNEEFKLTFVSGKRNIAKLSWQNIARKTIVLVRLDINGPPHTNPNMQVIECPHLHRYTEGYADKWAYPVDTRIFTNLSDVKLTLSQFLACCNVVDVPHIDVGLFV